MAENGMKMAQVGIVVGDQLLHHCHRLPSYRERTHMVLSLIGSYGLYKYLRLLPVRPAPEEELRKFHSEDYIAICKRTAGQADLELLADEAAECGLELDCPLISDLMDVICHVAGGSIVAAEALTKKTCRAVINWAGGWHHALPDKAAGFCYVNDVVLAILKLRTVFDKVLYVDLDVHHGDGVQDAFAFTTKVFTLSLHQFEDGFYPGTGSMDDVGMGAGKYYSLNIPFKSGLQGLQYANVFKRVFSEVLQAFRPNAIVIQCGADSLSFDPIGQFNLTVEHLSECVDCILQANLPCLFLGGGGYNFANVARCWTQLTWRIIQHFQNEQVPKEPLCEDIPDTDHFFCSYGPSFTLEVQQGRKINLNTDRYIEDLIERAKENLGKLKRQDNRLMP